MTAFYWVVMTLFFEWYFLLRCFYSVFLFGVFIGLNCACGVGRLS